MNAIISSEAQLENLLRRLASLRLMRLPKDCELSTPQVGILFWVRRSPGSGVLEIADELGVTGPTVSVAVRRLIKDGWLEQRTDPKDRRAKPLFLTGKSETLLEELRTYQKQALKLFISGLEQQEQQTFLSLFDKALNAVEEKFDLD